MLHNTELNEVNVIKDISYGEHERLTLDLYKVNSDFVRPLVFWFHGGKFTKGSKDDISKSRPIDLMLDAGITVAVPNYRLSQHAIYPGAMLDGIRAVQFGKYQALDWNIDPDRIAITGSSAGGMIALWIAFNKDFADKDNKDPVARISSLCNAVAVHNTQTTIEPGVLKQLIDIEQPVLQKFLGLIDNEPDTTRAHDLYKQVSAASYIHKNVPPVFLSYGGKMLPIENDMSNDERIHHPAFGKYLKEKLDSLGIENEFYYQGQDSSNSGEVDFFQKMVEFITKCLN